MMGILRKRNLIGQHNMKYEEQILSCFRCLWHYFNQSKHHQLVLVMNTHMARYVRETKCVFLKRYPFCWLLRLPAASLGTGSCVIGFIGFGFQL